MTTPNPFAKKANLAQTEPELFEAMVEVDDELVETVPEKPTAWQHVFRLVFGEGVAALPAAPFAPKTSKRRLRRLRGKAKAA